MSTMTTTTTPPPSYAHTPKSHLPPSPPPSPPAHRRRPKKRSESFEKLANTPLSSPPTESSDPLPDQKEEPLLTRIILTPVLITSFILSLTYINLRDRIKRTSAHSSSNSLLTYFFPSTWLDTEPYQDPDNGTWARRASVAGHVQPHDAVGPRDESGRKGKPHRGNAQKDMQERRSWYLHKKIRKVAKLEVSDAFEMRGRVMFGMVVFMALAFIAFVLLGRWVFSFLGRTW